MKALLVFFVLIPLATGTPVLTDKMFLSPEEIAPPTFDTGCGD